ncbi:MAG: hypothetical protein GEU93_07380 [Propionibacteriales bacterium]|nr:hypothetical protein [Propionibacteriales bacterium]
MVTTNPRAARLPAYNPTPRRRRGEKLRGVLSLIAILALVFGVPWALWTYGGGAPWPSSAPSMEWLTGKIGVETVVGVLVFVLWLAWLHFVVCVLVELFSERRASGLGFQVPAGGVGTQSLARRLVASVLLLAGSAAVSVPAATAATSSAADVSATVGQVQPAQARLATPAAEQAKGAAEASTQVAAKGSKISYTVQPPEGRHYDSLWDIAERFLGDGRRYKEIFRLNQGTLQADGRALREADLIYPGWVLALPDDAKGPGLHIREEKAPAPQKPGSGPPVEQYTGSVDAAGAAIGGAIGGTAGGTAGVAAQAGGSDGFLQYGVGGGLLAAGLIAGLARRRGWNAGSAGPTAEEEVALRLAADGPRAAFVNRALRALAHQMHEAGRPMPSVYAAYLDGTTLSLALSPAVTEDPPEGWTSDDAGRLWSIEQRVAESMHVPSPTLAPYPGLVTVGTEDDGTVAMLELETAPGIVALGGHVESARDVAVSMAVELATNLWSDDVGVTLVGFGDDLTELAPHRLRRVDRLDEVLAELEQHRERQHNICVHEGLDSVIRGRQARPDRSLWKPQFLVLSGAPTEEESQRLAELAGDPRHAVGVLTIGDVVTAPWRLVVSGEGRLTNHLLDLDVRAQRLPVEAYSRAVELFRTADVPDTGGDDGPSTPDPAPDLPPEMLDLERDAPVHVQLLGPVAVNAPGPIEPERLDLATEIVAYIAVHPYGVHPAVLDAAIWPRGVTEEVRNAAIGHVQRWLGENAAGQPRLDLDEEGRWVLDLTSVRVDWNVFRGLVRQALRGTGDTSMILAQAMSLVRGQAIDHVPAHRYTWLATSEHLRDIRQVVVDTAVELGRLAAAANDPVFAREALRAGLSMVPACEEIWRDVLRLASRFAGHDDVVAVADDMYAAIAAHGSPRGASPETDALVDELLPGYRRTAA